MDDRFAAYLPHIRRRWQEEQAGWERRRQRAWEEGRRVAALLREEFAARRVLAFGSLVDERRFDAHSDIDLAVEGVAFDQFFRAYAVAQGECREFKLDLVDLSSCPETLRQAILLEGEEL